MILLLVFLGLTSVPTVSANDRVLDFSFGCKIYKLDENTWKAVDSSPFSGFGLSNAQILKDEKFTVFKTEAGTYGVAQKCVVPGTPDAPDVNELRDSPVKGNGNGRSEWSAVFSLGLNNSPSGTIVSTVGGTSATITSKFKNSAAFMGGASYRMNSHIRLSAEIGMSQLVTDSSTGNETSFFDLSPELLFPAGKNVEVHIGPDLGFFFFSQNTQSDTLISFKQQTATALLLGVNLGADYALGSQFALGLFFQYLKPGALKITGTRLADSATTESVLSVSYLTLGTRFSIRF